ncbi:MAG: endonuclease III [Candidatus Lokiarchaeota archaeon]|nr:endonuclease III [Candidatus Lokiarchaeota archaeon]
MNFREILDKVENNIKGKSNLGKLEEKGSDPFKILIATVLSARTKDIMTEKVTEDLFKRYNTPELIATANLGDIEHIIKSIGFYRVKAQRIIDISNILIKKYNGIVPNNFQELVELPGVGPKTANCVLVFAFKIPAITVDTHIHRIPNRLGWIQTKRPEQSEIALKELIPKENWLRFSRLFVKFGQQICKPFRPKCNICPLESICQKDFTMEKELREKRKKTKEKKNFRIKQKMRVG